MLKDKGTLYMVHKPERLVDIIYQLRKNKIEPKEIRFVHPYEKKKRAKFNTNKSCKKWRSISKK